MSIEVRDVSKRFGPFVAVNGVSLHVRTGELIALLGPSGSGKTTLLRLIAGLEIPDAGSVLFDGEDSTNRRAADRRVGFVFQHYALFRHMTVFENIAFGLRVRPRQTRPSRAEIEARVHRLLGLVQLEAMAHRHPAQLSGGQRQRVALARALAVEPRVLLLDEPFGALDAKVRKELRRWLRRLHDELQVTSILVTHDQEEALEAADRVVVMNQGHIEQVGTPAEVYERPASAFVVDFLGDVNLFRFRIEHGKALIGNVAFDAPGREDGREARLATLYIRPHQLEINLEGGGGQQFRATVTHVNPAGPLVKVDLTAEWGDPVRVELSQERYRALNLKPGDRVFVSPLEMSLFTP
ncbi:MAG TPA: sulfate ABC transporter ATP-binding protein [Vicinamibacterales bacterium]|nr:sulfate ABC transporter ATP-binding protein [Vicinamibacterales bacterium]